MNRADRLAALRDPSYANTVAMREIFGKVQSVKGDPGRTPIRGVDYFTPGDIAALLAYIIPIVRSRVKDGRPGERGQDGHTPTRQELTALIEPLIPAPVPGPKGDPGPAGAAPKLSDIVSTVMTELQRKKSLSWEHIGGAPNLNDLAQLIEFLKRGGFRGGGGGGTSAAPTIYNDTVSGTIDGVNTVFTVPNTIQSPVFCSLGNANYQAVVDYTVTGPKQITFATAPDASLTGQPFWLAHT